jgi:hypothetical protein
MRPSFLFASLPVFLRAFTKCDVCINPPSPNPIHRIAAGNSRVSQLLAGEKLKFSSSTRRFLFNSRSLFAFVTRISEKKNTQSNLENKKNLDLISQIELILNLLHKYLNIENI